MASNYNLKIPVNYSSYTEQDTAANKEVPPININKGGCESVENMICDDWINFDDELVNDATKERDNQPNFAELQKANYISPKVETINTEFPTVQSPKTNKLKLLKPPPPTFQELLENLDYNILYLNLTKLLQFLESNTEEVCYQFTLKQYEDFFKMVILNITFLRSKNLNENYRDICLKIAEAANFKKTGYILTYVYEYRKEFQNSVLVIKKVYIKKNMPKEKESSLSSFSESLMPLSVSSSETDPKTLPRSTSPPSISNGFKIHCLRTMLAFIKNKVTKNIEFPELSKEQLYFMNLLLESILVFSDFDNNLEIKEMYNSLWETVRIYSQEYEFKIKTVDNDGERKSLVFEKILKETLAEATNLDQTANSNKLTVVSNKNDSASSQIMIPTIEDAKPVIPEIEVQKSVAPKMEVPEPMVPKIEAPKPMVPKNEAPKPMVKWLGVRPNKEIDKLLVKQRKLEKKCLFINNLPSTFVVDGLKSIIEFLSDDQRVKMVVVPKNLNEQQFYRKCIEWCRTNITGSMFTGEYKKLYGQIEKILVHQKCRVPKPSANKVNENTGIREVTYVKTPKSSHYCDEIAVPRLSKKQKKKMKLQNLLNETEITDDKTEVPNIFLSLRNKKKNKKLKNDKLIKIKVKKSKDKLAIIELSNVIAKSTKQYESDDSDSDTCSRDRATSSDRNKVSVTDNAIKRPPYRKRVWAHRETEYHRKELLREALSVPVQSDKAMKMMRGMGWSGGALGARGEGITEPIMPALDIAKGAGLGHGRGSTQQGAILKKPSISKTEPSWLSNPKGQTETNDSGTDMIVEKTKRLLVNDLSFDTLINTDFAKWNSEKSVNSNVGPPNTGNSNVEPPKTGNSNVEPPKTGNSNVEPPKTRNSNVEPPKPGNLNVESPKPTNACLGLPTLTRWMQYLQTPDKSNIYLTPFNFRQEMLQCILDLLTTEAQVKTLRYGLMITKRDRKYLTHALEVFKGWSRFNLAPDKDGVIYKIMEKYKEYPDILIKCFLSHDYKQVIFKKMPIAHKLLLPHQEVDSKFVASLIKDTEELTEQNLTAYIEALAPVCTSKKIFDTIKFRLLILLKILHFLNSNSDELEVAFNNKLITKQKDYIEMTVEAVNMRLKFGTSPAELKLSLVIKDLIKDAFLSYMYNHQYTTLTLNKHFRFRRLNRPDNSIKRKSFTTVFLELENPTSEIANVNNYPVNVTSNPVVNNNTIEVNNIKKSTGNYYDASDSDTSSVGEDNNNITKVPPFLPSEENRVSLSPYLCLYDKAKTNCTDDDKTFDESHNYSHNEPNVVTLQSNGNIGNDNNDNHVIDMKRLDTDPKNVEMVAEYIMCVDETNEKNKSELVNEKDDLSNISDYYDAESLYDEKSHKEIGNNNIETSMDILENIEDPVNQSVTFNDNTAYNDNDKYTQYIYSVKEENYLEDPFINDVVVKNDSTNNSKKEIVKDEQMEVCVKYELDEGISKNEYEKNVKNIISNDDVIMKAEDETDYDTNIEVNLGLSEDNCDKQLTDENSLDKKHCENKNMYVVQIHYPKELITRDKAKEIQKIISTKIEQTKELPLLMCHGVQHGALIYTCHNKKSYEWLQNTIHGIHDLEVLEAKHIQKMALKCYLFDFDISYLFRMIELYNHDISTKDWVVEKTENYEDYSILLVRMDKFSIDYIQESGLALYAGVDKVEFSMIWE